MDEKRKINFKYEGFEPCIIPEDNEFSIIQPNIVAGLHDNDEELIWSCLKNPIGTNVLREEVKGCTNVVILADDYTRHTPTHLILPMLIKELQMGGVSLENISILVASGTHRAMSDEEKVKKFGEAVVDSITIQDHEWSNRNHLSYLGKTERGTDVLVNTTVLEADYVIGVGQIVPHRVAGFSGGAKIVQPGVCGALTTGQTHWLSAKDFHGKDIIGISKNPVRSEINEVGKRAGLRFIFNTVQIGDNNIYKCFCGDPEQAHFEGCKAALEIFGSYSPRLSDIAIVDVYPSHMNMWQAAKGVYAADLALKEDGILILVAPCEEGVSNEHPEVEQYGYSDPDMIKKLVISGAITDLTIAAHLLHVGTVITGERKAFLISTGISRDLTEHIGFTWKESVQQALSQALEEKGKDSTICYLKYGGEVMPIKENNDGGR